MKGTLTERAALSALVAALISTLVGTTFSRLSSTAVTGPSTFSVGTVSLGDNDAGAAVVSMAAAKPGDSRVGCIRVQYDGSLPAKVRLYAQISGSLAPALSLTVTRGSDSSPSFNSCSGFAADSTDYLGAGPGVIFSGRLDSYPASYAGGLVDPHAPEAETWTANEAHSYMYAVSFEGDTTNQGQSATVSFVWEARNV